MNKLSAELLEEAAESIRSAALNKVRWDKAAHEECDPWNDEHLTDLGREILDVAEEIASRVEELL